jgi:uncharacterized membrane protein
MSATDDTTPIGAPLLRRAGDRAKVVLYESKPRSYFSRFLLVADFLIFMMTVGHFHGPLRVFLGVILCVAIPGWSVVGLLKLENAAIEIALSLALSLALLMITAEILMSLHSWDLVVLEEITSFVCLPSLAWQSQRRREARRTWK